MIIYNYLYLEVNVKNLWALINTKYYITWLGIEGVAGSFSIPP